MDIMKFRPFFYVFSIALIAISLFSIVRWGFRPSIDFAGGSVLEIKFPGLKNAQDEIKNVFSKQKISKVSITSTGTNQYLLKFISISNDQKISLNDAFKKLDPKYEEIQFQIVGPVLGQELLRKTIYALILSAIAMLLFIGSRFDDYTFGLGAVLAMLHDSVILIGSFSLLGHFFGAEFDALFVTALLTTLSASVHDTVVTFDRIRELKRQTYKLNWVELSNEAVTQTLSRSINNSLTVMFMLFALVMLGGTTTHWFAMALLIGYTCGTYSSTGVAIPLVLLFKRKQLSSK
jgi:preprotein translocase subunit SecF